ncbi:Thioredoxin domain protein [Rippkaea orientalis PCC 8801]|uniref:Thioredoxin domain protein n=1 Tax=Rippkaea orientalis (strain PCC 8801 / RF-1) TaxID=41431 RepID=B7JVT0_RIPO1|nr:tetratricopeptide repeat protein [Rippkaea orientalis]ACK64651.1 Thioredoxin domain protein [Rippkaea orientalis PCC 8801]
MGYVIDVDQDNFEREVIENSYKKPVIIDFYATWCGPCKLLKPILENLQKEYDFILAKIDIDQQPQLAQQFKVEGVPDVKIAINGQMIPGFVGVLPEPEIRELLEQLNLPSEVNLKIEAVRQAIAEQNAPKAKQIFDELFAKYPDHPPVILEAATFLIRVNRLEEAEKLLKTIRSENREYYNKAQSMQSLIAFQQIANNHGDSELDELFAKGAQLTLVEDYEGALNVFLHIVQQNRKYRDDGARKAMISLFNLLGNNHPLTKKYQQELMLTLY